MTTKEILDKQQIFSRDELEKLKRDELVQLSVKYSLKHNGLRKDVLIDSILKYQEHINDIKSKLVTNNPIEQYHRGTVEYRLPTLIINRIIRDLWHEDIDLCLNTDNLRRNYRWLLSIALVSKEFFKLISSLFSSFKTKPNNRIENADTFYLAHHLRSSVLSPHSVLKNIGDLTISIQVFSAITKKSVCAPIELGLIFNNVRRFCMSNDNGNWRPSPIQAQQCKSIVQYMPNIESLVFLQAYIGLDLLQSIKTLPRLTSLDISKSEFPKIAQFTSDLLSHSIKKLKLPMRYNSPYKSILSDQHQLTTFGIGRITLAQIQMISGHFMHFTKLIIKKLNEEMIAKFEKLLCLPDCKVRTLITDTIYVWIERVLNQNQLIDTIDVNCDLDDTFALVSKSPSIKRFIFSHNKDITTDQYKLGIDNHATGFAHVKSKSFIYRAVGYAAKIYNVSENQDDNTAVESTYPHLKFLYYRIESVSSYSRSDEYSESDIDDFDFNDDSDE
ncbi:hypothetical protein PPL_01990 [Heterostelium album PN500]|uniref:Uncharacterized protein n=1 Tax=Heterostelium pallidum (strain ATCC 26659 / Pp 5 / PN500) TaxID=670386 RepID=D3B122_HETP5|nr:hypothetical protein PPL_01990 [Heterostelium album PN500]EFA84996.1 hypothetical protein PPL_01990 [Heterostelium album PN500]|eukprot:XP_020437106.1 hypothetical protein PPL_01990 [Heterostelium album PN500]